MRSIGCLPLHRVTNMWIFVYILLTGTGDEVIFNFQCLISFLSTAQKEELLGCTCSTVIT